MRHNLDRENILLVMKVFRTRSPRSRLINYTFDVRQV